MMSDRRFEQDLPGLLEDLYMGPMPAYRDVIVQRTADAHQRPAWSFLRTWLPQAEPLRNGAAASGPVADDRAHGVTGRDHPGSRGRPIVGFTAPAPEPFGLARAGLVAFAQDGDIYTVDPATGLSTAVVIGPETDRDPRWSRDGTQLAFLRCRGRRQRAEPALCRGSERSPCSTVTPEPIAISGLYGFSPDGSQILLTVEERPGPGSHWCDPMAAGARTLEGAWHVAARDSGPSWRPPDGAEVLFAHGNLSLHAVNPESGVVRTIVAPSNGLFRETPMWSPDGSRLAYIEYVSSDGMTAQIHVVEADGSNDRRLPLPPGAVWQAFRGWSNDGTRLIAIRGYTVATRMRSPQSSRSTGADPASRSTIRTSRSPHAARSGSGLPTTPRSSESCPGAEGRLRRSL